MTEIHVLIDNTTYINFDFSIPVFHLCEMTAGLFSLPSHPFKNAKEGR